MAKLTTHVLDIASGKPAAGVRVVLRHPSAAAVVSEGMTNADGRLDRPLLEGEAFEPGAYEISFHVGDYFRQAGVTLDSAFLDVVPVRFTAAGGDYHVPLLVAPYGYSTYRGS
jgi:5-hydroxyisourate hydrolase